MIGELLQPVIEAGKDQFGFFALAAAAWFFATACWLKVAGGISLPRRVLAVVSATLLAIALLGWLVLISPSAFEWGLGGLAALSLLLGIMQLASHVRGRPLNLLAEKQRQGRGGQAAAEELADSERLATEKHRAAFSSAGGFGLSALALLAMLFLVLSLVISDARKKVNAARAAEQQAQSDLAEESRLRKDAEEELSQTRKQIVKLSGELETARGTIQTMARDLKSREQVIGQLDAQLQKYAISISKLTAEYKRLVASRDAIQRRLAAAEGDLADARSELKAETERRVAGESTVNQQSVTIADLRQRISLLERPGRYLLQTSGRVDEWDDSGWRKVNRGASVQSGSYYESPAVASDNDAQQSGR